MKTLLLTLLVASSSAYAQESCILNVDDCWTHEGSFACATDPKWNLEHYGLVIGSFCNNVVTYYSAQNAYIALQEQEIVSKDKKIKRLRRKIRGK